MSRTIPLAPMPPPGAHMHRRSERLEPVVSALLNNFYSPEYWRTNGAGMDNGPMQGLGDRLRARARELGVSDSEVARRSGVGQTAYANYVSDRHEPNLPTFVRICAVLGASPNDLLGRPTGIPAESVGLRERVTATMEAMDAATLALLARVADGLVATSGRPPVTRRVGRPALPRREAPVRDAESGSE